MKRTLSGAAEPIPAAVPKSLAAVIRQATQVEKDARYPSVAAQKREIDEFRKGFSTIAEGAGISKEALLFLRRNKWPVVVACFFLCIIAGLTVFYVGNLQTKNQALQLRTQELIHSQKTAEDAKHMAERQRDSAEQERDSAERARLAEAQANRKVQKLNLDQIHQQMNNVIYEWPVSAAEFAAKSWEEQRQIHGDTAQIMAGLQQCLFIAQYYEQVVEIQPQTEAMEQLKVLATPLLGIRKANLSSMELRDLASELATAGHYTLAINILLGDSDRFSPEQRNYFPAVLAILAAVNPEWDPSQVEYLPEKGILRLTGRGLKQLSDRPWSIRTPLRLLHVKHLDIRGSGISHMDSIRPLNLYSIDIRDTPVTELETLKWTRNLREIIVEKGRFPKGSTARKVAEYQLIEK